jgi:rubredoxin
MKKELKCSLCGHVFLKEVGEINRRHKFGQTEFFCSRTCGGKHSASQNLSKNWGTKNSNLQRNGRIADEYTPFREYLRRVRRRYQIYDITLEDLKTQWDIQNGHCPYSKVKLVLADSYGKHKTNPIYLASLDRIDSSIGYVRGNIQWVSAAMNYAKSTMSHELVLEFCEVMKKA